MVSSLRIIGATGFLLFIYADGTLDRRNRDLSNVESNREQFQKYRTSSNDNLRPLTEVQNLDSNTVLMRANSKKGSKSQSHPSYSQSRSSSSRSRKRNKISEIFSQTFVGGAGEQLIVLSPSQAKSFTLFMADYVAYYRSSGDDVEARCKFFRQELLTEGFDDDTESNADGVDNSTRRLDNHLSFQLQIVYGIVWMSDEDDDVRNYPDFFLDWINSPTGLMQLESNMVNLGVLNLAYAEEAIPLRDIPPPVPAPSPVAIPTATTPTDGAPTDGTGVPTGGSLNSTRL